MFEDNLEEKTKNSAEESFEEMLRSSSALPPRLRPGQSVKTKVAGVSGETVYIEIGGKSEGEIDLGEFRGDDGEVRVKAGDEVEAFFINVKDGSMRFTTLIRGYSPVEVGSIRSACEAGIPVAGDVKEEIKGGFAVSVGGVRCFCPFSQMDLAGKTQRIKYVGMRLNFKVLEFKEGGRNVVLSRRALLEEEMKACRERLKETVVPGAVVKGAVRSVEGFGAFVDLGGMDGLVPQSEVSWDRSERAENVLSEGQEIEAKVINADWENGRITLSIKALSPDPWEDAALKYPSGSRIEGAVVRLTHFGAFVNIEPGIDGLIHISNLGTGRRISHPKEVIETGQRVEAYVLSVDSANRKIALSLKPQPGLRDMEYPEPEEFVEGIVEKVMPFGVFVKLGDFLTGLIPNSEMGTSQGTDHKRILPVGSTVRTVVIDVDKARGKVTLSRKAVMEKAEREDYVKYRESVKEGAEGSTGLGTLGDILKARGKNPKEKDTGR